MGKALLVAANGTATGVSNGPTNYLIVGGCRPIPRPETLRQAPARIAGTFANLAAKLDATGTARVHRFRKNAVNGAQVLTIADAASGLFADAVNSDALAAGDKFAISFAGTGAQGFFYERLVFTAASGHGSYYVGLGHTLIAGTTRYMAPCGPVDFVAATDVTAVKGRAPGTLVSLFTAVEANPATATITLTTQVNAADTAQQIAVTAGATGLFEDFSHTVPLASGDLFVIKAVNPSASGDVKLTLGGFGFASAAQTNDIFGGAATAAGANFSGPQRYLPISGQFLSSTTDEPSCQMQHGFAGYCSNLRARVSVNTANGNARLNLRKNALDGAQAATITAGGTGWFEDVSGQDGFAPSDEVSLGFLGLGTSTSITIMTTGLTEAEGAAPVMVSAAPATRMMLMGAGLA